MSLLTIVENAVSKKKKQYYVVVHGRRPGIYRRWYGQDGASEQIEGFPDAIYKGFYTRKEVHEWLSQFSTETLLELAPNLLDLRDSSPAPQSADSPDDLLKAGRVLVYTDGAAIDNPGPGGFGVVLRHGPRRKELAGGFRLTTNNRMELMACIQGLRALKFRCSVVLFCDSTYVVNGMTHGWAERWQAKGWQLSGGQRVKNSDLWEQLVYLCKQHEVEFKWVRGHAGNRENETCDRLAVAAARRSRLDIDMEYEASNT